MNYLDKVLGFFFIMASCFAGCKSINGVQMATSLGATGGETFGEIFGEAYGNASEGAVIGTSLGEVTGSVIGATMDKQTAYLRKELPTAKVNRSEKGMLVVFNNKSLFNNNPPALTSTAKKHLGRLVDIFKKYPNSYFEIASVPDVKNSNTKSLALSEKRGTIVALYLEKQGIDSNRIAIKTAPGLTNNNPGNTASSSSRVEILILPGDPAKAKNR